MLTAEFNSKFNPAVLIKFPNRETTTGKLLNEYLNSKLTVDDRSLHLLFAANRWEEAQRINRLISHGVTVIADRFSYSGIAYSVAKKVPIEWCINSEIGLPIPDAIFYMDGGGAVANYDTEIYENAAFQEKVYTAYIDLFNEFDHDIIKINAKNSREEICKFVVKTAQAVLTQLKS